MPQGPTWPGVAQTKEKWFSHLPTFPSKRSDIMGHLPSTSRLTSEDALIEQPCMPRAVNPIISFDGGIKLYDSSHYLWTPRRCAKRASKISPAHGARRRIYIFAVNTEATVTNITQKYLFIYIYNWVYFYKISIPYTNCISRIRIPCCVMQIILFPHAKM